MDKVIHIIEEKPSRTVHDLPVLPKKYKGEQYHPTIQLFALIDPDKAPNAKQYKHFRKMYNLYGVKHGGDRVDFMIKTRIEDQDLQGYLSLEYTPFGKNLVLFFGIAIEKPSFISRENIENYRAFLKGLKRLAVSDAVDTVSPDGAIAEKNIGNLVSADKILFKQKDQYLIF